MRSPLFLMITGCRSDHDFGYFHIIAVEGTNECIHHTGIEGFAGAVQDDLLRLERRAAFAIGPVGGDGVKGVSHGDDASFNRYLITLGGMVAGTVITVVMRKNNG